LITVHTKDGEESFEGRCAYATDEHNNLEILTGPDESVAVFAHGYWVRAVMSDGE
jgi:hypothetical protein